MTDETNEPDVPSLADIAESWDAAGKIPENENADKLLQDPGAVEELWEHIRDEEYEKIENAFLSAVFRANDRDWKRLERLEPETRGWLAGWVLSRPEAPSDELFRAIVADPAEAVRVKFREWAREHEPLEEDLEFLNELDAAGEYEPERACWAAQILDYADQQLWPYLASPDPEIRSAVVTGITKRANQIPPEVMHLLLAKGKGDDKRTLAKKILASPAPDIDYLRLLAKDGKVEIRRRVARWFLRGDEALVDEVVPYLISDDDIEIKEAIVQYLVLAQQRGDTVPRRIYRKILATQARVEEMGLVAALELHKGEPAPLVPGKDREAGPRE